MMYHAVREPTDKLNKEGFLFKYSLPNPLNQSLVEHQYKKNPAGPKLCSSLKFLRPVTQR